MSDLSAADFDEFFHALWGYAPFPWQSDLARRVLAPRSFAANETAAWPAAIVVPTSAGKTACLDIAVFALAASLGSERPTARRIWFVVDRRVIVDEAYERARKLARKLDAAQSGVVGIVARRLREIADGGPPLTTHLLRGGVYRDDAWAHSPLQPSVIASTVDQFGSRLLFRAYGRSFKAWPLQAGLAGNDSLVLLDEAHCAQPFLETLRAVVRYRALAEERLPSPLDAVVLSATPPADATDRHGLTPADHAHLLLGARLRAKKPALLPTPITCKGTDPTPLAEALAKAAKGLIDPAAGRLAVVVFCNRVATAKAVYQRLAKDEQTDTVLLTGRMRPLDKDATVSGWLSRLSANDAESRRLERPVIVVATQTLEVGANLDFDALVSECASLDALRQRFGRLNRSGREVEAKAVVLVRADQAKTSDDDPVYGAALGATWNWLKAQAGESGEIDFGIEALAPRLPGGEALAALNSPSAHAPVLLPAHLDALAQTAPMPAPSPDPALFLHGPARGAADVQVCWRADFDPLASITWADTAALCPPVASECLAVPFGRMRDWLSGAMRADDSSDVEGISVPAAEEKPRGEPRPALRWFGRDDHEVIRGAGGLRPGDVLILPAAVGGLEELGHRPPDAMLDLGDRAQFEARGKALLRLHPEVMAEWPPIPACERLLALAHDRTRRDDEPEDWLDELRAALDELAHSPLPPGVEWLSTMATELACDPALARLIVDHPAGGIVLRGSRRLRRDADGGFSAEDDVTASGNVRVELTDHLQRVGARARIHAERIGLPESLVSALESAGANHDLGKADPRFQAWLHGGRAAIGPLLAKSAGLPQHPLAARRARERAGYPEGGRHELLSVRLLEAAGLDAIAEPDLARHLIASHHGHARPFAPVVDDHTPLTVRHPVGIQAEASSATRLESLDSGVPERFWRLNRRFGWWGLAGLEALLQLADHIESAKEQR